VRKSRKLFISLVAVVLTVVAAVAATVATLAATSQNVGATISVTYTANNVKATVTLKGKTQGGTWSTVTGDATKSFDVTEDTVTKNVSMSAIGLGGFVSGTFQRYAVYQFAFKNDYTSSQGCVMYVEMADSYLTDDKNVFVNYQKSSSADVPAVSLTTTNQVTSCGSGWSTSVPPKFEVAKAGTQYVYMIVGIEDVTKNINGYSNNGITFTLTTSAS